MLDELVAGERSPQILAERAKGRMRAKIPELVEALTGRFTEHHAFICQMHLERIDQLSNWIEQLTELVDEAMQPFLPARDFLTTIRGVSALVADVLIAETDADMDRFEDAGHLCSWAGITPGHHQSAGRVKSAHTRPGNRSLKGALGVAALVIARHPTDTYLGARYQRLVHRRGKPKALVATERSILTAVWHMLANGECYHEADAGFFALKDLDRALVQRGQTTA